MLYPGNNKLIRWFFDHYINYIIGRNFHQVNFNQVPIDRSCATLLVANHYSWWDGFIFHHLNKKLFKKRPHIMVLETTMKRWPFMKHLGAFSINPQSKDVVNSLTYAAKLLDDPDNLLLVFPQGKICSNFTDEVQFEKGLSRIIAQSSGKFQYIMAASFTEHFNLKKPTVNVYLKTKTIPPGSINAISQAYNRHYNESKQLQTQKVV